MMYMREENEEDNETCQTMINSLTASLREEVLVETYYKVLIAQKVFELNFSEQFLKKLALCVKEKKVSEEVIYQEGEIPQKLFILVKGSVDRFLNKKNFLTA